MRNSIKILAGLMAVLAMGIGPVRGAAPERRPNVLFILADDYGWSDTRCYGSTFYDTPALDRLAERSVRFTSAYAACPVCSPSRAAILTGKYPVRTEITDYIGAAFGNNWKRNTRLLPAPYVSKLALSETTTGAKAKIRQR